MKEAANLRTFERQKGPSIPQRCSGIVARFAQGDCLFTGEAQASEKEERLGITNREIHAEPII